MGRPPYPNARCRDNRPAFLPEQFQVGIDGNEQFRLAVAKIHPVEFAINGQRRAKFSGAVGQ
jgi:hypothetical protein